MEPNTCYYVCMNWVKSKQIIIWAIFSSLLLTFLTAIPILSCKDLLRPYTFTNPFGIYPENYGEGMMVPMICIQEPHPYFIVFASILSITTFIFCFQVAKNSPSLKKRMLFGFLALGALLSLYFFFQIYLLFAGFH